jgi:hypothetical protein
MASSIIKTPKKRQPLGSPVISRKSPNNGRKTSQPEASFRRKKLLVSTTKSEEVVSLANSTPGTPTVLRHTLDNLLVPVAYSSVAEDRNIKVHFCRYPENFKPKYEKQVYDITDVFPSPKLGRKCDIIDDHRHKRIKQERNNALRRTQSN